MSRSSTKLRAIVRVSVVCLSLAAGASGRTAVPSMPPQADGVSRPAGAKSSPAPALVIEAPAVEALRSDGMLAWRVLGQASVRLGSSRVTIRIPAAASGTRAVKIQVARAVVPLRIETLTIRFKDGSTEVVEIRADVAGGAETRVIELASLEPVRIDIAYTSRVVSSTSDGIARLRLAGRR